MNNASRSKLICFGHKILLTASLVASITFVTRDAIAQDCNNLCSQEFWATSSQDEIGKEILISDVNATDTEGYTPLHVVASMGKDLEIEMLIEAGANPIWHPYQGVSPAEFAVRGSNPAAVLALLNAVGEHGGDINGPLFLNATLLHVAITFNNPATIIALLEAGIDGTKEDDRGMKRWSCFFDQFAALLRCIWFMFMPHFVCPQCVSSGLS